MLECVNSKQLATKGEGDVELSVHPEESSTEERNVSAGQGTKQAFSKNILSKFLHVKRKTGKFMFNVKLL